ncbi:FkbM family methyltransferase [Synechococcus sp. LTW-G]
MANLTVYGFGNRGRDVIDQLIAQGEQVGMIFDRSPSASTYRDIPVRTLEDPDAQTVVRGSRCLIALHNGYVDIREIYSNLKSIGSTPISLVNAHHFGLSLSLYQPYWLDTASPGFRISDDDAGWMTKSLADARSVSIFSALRRYRETGEISDCPAPSSSDVYTPNDLHRYNDPVHLLDCGACVGDAFTQFAREYSVASYFAFEPDATNFERLANRKFACDNITILPLGVSSRTELLHFQAGNGHGSLIDPSGESVIQCVSVDDIAKSYCPTVVKFDVEGAERHALLGMRRLITRCRPDLCVSVYHRPEDLISIPKLLDDWNLGYRFYLRTHEHNGFGTVLYARKSYD